MQLMVPTIMAECIAAQLIETDGRVVAKVGEIISLPYGQALQLRAVGMVGAFVDEIAKHLEATEALGIYGGDSWFPQRLQTIGRVSDYLAQKGATEQEKLN